MVFTNAQTRAFFSNKDQIGLPDRMITQLALEGITRVDDIAEFKDDDWKQLVTNLRNPPPIPGVAPANAPQGAPPPLVAQQPFTLGVRSLRRLKICAHMARYLIATDRVLSAANMHYTNCVSNFEEQWTAMQLEAKKDEKDVPKITRNLRMTRWSESFLDYTHTVIGVRDTPLAYVIRENANVVNPAPPLANNRPHSLAHGSVEAEMIARLSHTSPVFKDDNKKVYNLLEEATRGTVFSETLSVFQRTKDGRGAYFALIKQHAGSEKWEKELEIQEDFLKNRVWKGNTNFSLTKFVANHRSAYLAMEKCSSHIPYQLPDERARVRYLIKAIQSDDAGVNAAIAAINNDDEGPQAMRANFERAANMLIKNDPITKRKVNTRGGGANATVSSTSMDNDNDANVSSASSKPGIGKTGVHLRYYKTNEYLKLNRAQKVELKQWREGKDGGSPSKRSGKVKRSGVTKSDDNGYNNNKKMKALASQVFAEERKKLVEQQEKDKATTNELKEAIIATMANAGSVSASTPSAKSVSFATSQAENLATKLQGIMGRSPDKQA